MRSQKTKADKKSRFIFRWIRSSIFCRTALAVTKRYKFKHAHNTYIINNNNLWNILINICIDMSINIYSQTAEIYLAHAYFLASSMRMWTIQSSWCDSVQYDIIVQWNPFHSKQKKRTNVTKCSYYGKYFETKFYLLLQQSFRYSQFGNSN